MNTPKVLAGLVILAALATAQCGDDKPDTAQYDAICQKVLKCDKSMQDLQNNPALPANADVGEQCKKSLAEIEKKAPNSIQGVKDCINNTACEDLKFATCLAPAQAELMKNIPGAQGIQ
ncbi:MAG: hypothetical protein CMN76_10665 [Spirochaetaceae bacterium]|nr:hypothetical protein [Spirochaetaceae bacterium]|tara:strand:+ start:1933 stop:2289 length:357 start_codon:yes stop_codon:yes gene_type:complete